MANVPFNKSLTDFAHRNPPCLSISQSQRIAIRWVLITPPARSTNPDPFPRRIYIRKTRSRLYPAEWHDLARNGTIWHSFAMRQEQKFQRCPRASRGARSKKRAGAIPGDRFAQLAAGTVAGVPVATRCLFAPASVHPALARDVQSESAEGSALPESQRIAIRRSQEEQ